MLIIPLAGRLDLRRPPLVTLSLILVNVLVFLSLAGSDDQAYNAANRIYIESGLHTLEAPLYREQTDQAWLDQWDLAAVPESDAALAGYIISDLSFDAIVQAELEAATDHSTAQAWRESRAAFEQVRLTAPTLRYGLIPADRKPLTFVTSMFLHGGPGHLIGNMIFLFLFGFSLERVLGALRYAATYLVAGLLGGLLHLAVHSGSYVPTIGASGAVSGLMGAYIAVYQLRRIKFFYSVLFYFGEFQAPALALLPFWLGKELYGFYFGDVGIAYWVHIGGLLGGVAIGLLLHRLGGVQDVRYLDESSAGEARSQMLETLDEHMERFSFDQARSLTARWLQTNPDDIEVWIKYAGLMEDRITDPAYDSFASGLFALAAKPMPANEAERYRELAHTVFLRYRERPAPHSALNSQATLCALGKLFLRDGHMDSVRRIANVLLKTKTPVAEAGLLVKLLSQQLAKDGDNDQAQKYWKLYKQRFTAQATS